MTGDEKGHALSERRPIGRRESKGVLFVVATPIGNLDDITLRALKILKQVQLVAAEDTRRTGILLRHFQIETPILSVHEHNERARVDRIVGRLAKGESVALVTDAGTPGISDPGAALVAAIREQGFTVEPVPGASAVIAAISASGITSPGFIFLGFPPIRGKARKEWFDTVVAGARHRLVVFFEAPHKLQKTLGELAELVNRPIILARELTKLHEEFATGTPSELQSRFPEPHGEFTIMVPPQDPAENDASDVTDAEVLDVFGRITESGQSSSKRDAARMAGEQLGLTAKQVYEILERNK